MLALGLGALAAVCCVWSWMAYTYLFGTAVSVSIGDECLGKYQSGTSGTIECWDANWPLDSPVHYGTLIDYRQSGGAFEYDVIKARAFGDTARTQPISALYVAGLAGPVVLVGSAATFLLRLRASAKKRHPLYH